MRSPERERLKLPTNVVSSATTSFACMKSCTDSGVQGIDSLPLQGAPSSTLWRSGIFHSLTPFVRHWPKDLVDLGVVDDAGEVGALLLHDLDQRAEDRAGRQHGGRDSDPLLRLAEVLRDAMRQRLAMLRREPGAHASAADVGRARVDLARALDDPGVPELPERERVRVGDLAATRPSR